MYVKLKQAMCASTHSHSRVLKHPPFFDVPWWPFPEAFIGGGFMLLFCYAFAFVRHVLPRALARVRAGWSDVCISVFVFT